MDEKIVVDYSKISEAVAKTDPVIQSGGQVQDQLMRKLADEIKRLADKVDFYDTSGQKVKLKVYQQLTPYRETEEDDDIFPYCVIKFDSSRMLEPGGREEVKLVLGFGIWVENKDRQYQHTFFNLYNRITRRFIGNNFLDNFRCEPEMSLALSPTDEETYPAYYAAIGMTWMIPGIDREVDFYS